MNSANLGQRSGRYSAAFFADIFVFIFLWTGVWETINLFVTWKFGDNEFSKALFYIGMATVAICVVTWMQFTRNTPVDLDNASSDLDHPPSLQ